MSDNKGLMAGKRGLIMGVANNRSIAWGIAKSCAAQGAELAFTYQGDALKKRVEPLAAEIGSKIVVPCDVTDMASIDATFETIARDWGKLDFRRPCHRLLRQGRADRPLRRHHARQFHQDDVHQRAIPSQPSPSAPRS